MEMGSRAYETARRIRVGKGVAGPPTLTDDLILFVGTDGTLSALDRKVALQEAP